MRTATFLSRNPTNDYLLHIIDLSQGGEEVSLRIIPSPVGTSEGGMVRSCGANTGDVHWYVGPDEGGALICPTETNIPQRHGAESCNDCLRTCQVSDSEVI